MRRILLSCALLAVLFLPAAAAAGASASSKPGYVVVRGAAGDGGINGRPVVTVVVRGFVLGRVSVEGQVDIIQLGSVTGRGAPQVTAGVSTRRIRWHGLAGKRFTGSSFRFRAIDGLYRVVVRGSGVYLFAGGRGHVTLLGSSFNKQTDGKYSVNGRVPRSLPATPLTRAFGGA
jgi:hypothetical protein